MARFFILFAVILQISYIYADIENIDDVEEHESLRDVLNIKPTDEDIKEFKATDTEWMDLFILPKTAHLPSTSSASKMATVLNSEKTPEEQLEEIKEMANQITLAIQSEMANLLSFALKDTEIENHENSLRKRRSAETPMDSTQLIMRLLKHIKSNNENQNIAIEKMMTAQEIADKFGIDFAPDTDIFSDLAIASSKQTDDLSSILRDVYNSKNVSNSNQIEFIPLNNEPAQSSHENNTYYVYSTVVPEEKIVEHMNTPSHFEYMPERVDSQVQPEKGANHMHCEPQYSYYFNIPIETQIPAPPVHHHAPVSHMPKFYEPPMYTPVEYYPYYYQEPMTTTTTIILPIEECEPEPRLVIEEFEETVTSKVLVESGDEPGSTTVNHVMTYTVSEKSHFKTPQIEKLPQQMQYYFFLL